MNRVCRVLVSAIISGLALSACAQVDREGLNARINTVTTDVPDSWQVGGTPKAVRSENWIMLFEDPLLADYLARAEIANFDIRQARINIAGSQQAVLQARSSLLPNVNASTGAGVSGVLESLSNVNDSSNASLSFFWDPDIFGVRRAGVRQSQASLRAQQAVAFNIRQQVLANVAQLYVAIIQSELQLELARTNLGFLEDRFRISEAQFKSGAIGGDELAFAETNFQSSLAGFRIQELATRQTRRALSLLLGDFGEDDLAVADILPVPILLPEQGVPASALERRPDVQLAWAQIEIAIAGYEISVADDWPTLNFSGSIGGGGPDIGDIFEPSTYLASLAANIAGNVFDGGLNKAQRESARLNTEGALLNYEQVIRGAKAEIEDIYDQDQVSKSSLEALQDASTAGNEALRLEQIRFDLGESDLLSVLQVQQTVNGVNAARINAEANLLSNQIEAYLATGGDLETPRSQATVWGEN
ncbi:MAG: TolC family protein [Hyphomonadaceae bacterium]